MLPDAAMCSGLMQCIHEWPALVGAVLGGVFALLVAFVVAHAQTRREQRAAASILLIDLLAVRAADKSPQHTAAEREVADDPYPLWLAEKLWRTREPDTRA